ncbi:MAG: purine-nucleoside phosphorylase [Campylobacterota bacterium]|nr:purine-nucleoside phosphorylase [Campylobacterota bacterium]
MIICAGNNETFSYATPIGVGLIESAINLTRICLFDKPDFLLFVGSAGSYDENSYKIFDIVESTSAANIELAFLNNDCYTPLENVFNSQTKMAENQTIVNSSNYISTNKKLAKNFLKYNIAIENMEFYSLLQVAKEFDIPVAGIFIITNYTNKEAHQDFIKNHQEAKAKLTAYLEIKNIIK